MLKSDHVLSINTCHGIKSSRSLVKIILVPVCLEVLHLDAGVEDERDEIDICVVHVSVPLAQVCKAVFKSLDHRLILLYLRHCFPLLLHELKSRQHLKNGWPSGG